MTDKEILSPPEEETIGHIDVDSFTDDDWYALVRSYYEDMDGLSYDDPRHIAADRRLYRLLGITPTNNMYLWFSPKPPLPLDGQSDEYFDASMYNFMSSAHDELPCRSLT